MLIIYRMNIRSTQKLSNAEHSRMDFKSSDFQLSNPLINSKNTLSEIPTRTKNYTLKQKTRTKMNNFQI